MIYPKYKNEMTNINKTTSMKVIKEGNQDLDETSEYYRECLYCHEPFMANHQLRRFCIIKNGIPNYCKNRYKVLVQGARLAGENVIVNHKQDVPPISDFPKTTKAFDGLVTEDNIVEWEKESIIKNANQEKNIKVLDDLLFEGKPISIKIFELIALGFDFYGYNVRKQLPKTNLFFIEIGIYALFWTTKNEILISPITEVLWI